VEVTITRAERLTLFAIAQAKGVSPKELAESVLRSAIHASQDVMSKTALAAIAHLLANPARTVVIDGEECMALTDASVQHALKHAGLNYKTVRSIWADRGVIVTHPGRHTFLRPLTHEGRTQSMWVFGKSPKKSEPTSAWIYVDVRPALRVISKLPHHRVDVAGTPCIAISHRDMLKAVPDINDLKESLAKRHVLIRSDTGRYRYPVTINSKTQALWVFVESGLKTIVGV